MNKKYVCTHEFLYIHWYFYNELSHTLYPDIKPVCFMSTRRITFGTYIGWYSSVWLIIFLCLVCLCQYHTLCYLWYQIIVDEFLLYSCGVLHVPLIYITLYYHLHRESYLRKAKTLTTLNSGSLGSQIDEERS